MAKLTRDEVLKLAKLSRLKLSDDEVERLQTELSEILKYVEILNEVDTTGTNPTYQVSGLKNIYRKDVVKNYGYTSKDLLKNAPAIQDNQFKVKRVL